MDYVQALRDKHAAMGVTKFHVSLGPEAASITAQDWAREVLSAYWQMERGHCASSRFFDIPWWHYGNLINAASEVRAGINRFCDGWRGIANPYRNTGGEV